MAALAPENRGIRLAVRYLVLILIAIVFVAGILFLTRGQMAGAGGITAGRAAGNVDNGTASENRRAVRGRATQGRRWRPLPSVCSSVASSRTEASWPLRLSISRSSFVDPVECTVRTSTVSSRTASASQCSTADASSGGDPGPA